MGLDHIIAYDFYTSHMLLGNHNAFNKSYAEYIVKGDRNDIVDKRLTHSGPLDKDGSCPWYRGPHPSTEADKLTRESGTALLPDGLLGTFSASLIPINDMSADR